MQTIKELPLNPSYIAHEYANYLIFSHTCCHATSFAVHSLAVVVVAVVQSSSVVVHHSSYTDRVHLDCVSAMSRSVLAVN